MWQQKQLLYNKRYTGWVWAPSLPSPGHLGPGALLQPGASTHPVGIKLRRCPYTKTWEWRIELKKQKVGPQTSNFCSLSSKRRRQLSLGRRARGQYKVLFLPQSSIDFKRSGSSDEQQIQDTPPHAAAGLTDPVPSGFSAGEVLIPTAEEYATAFPNDYEKVVRGQREARQRQRELERQKREKTGVKPDLKLVGFSG